MSHFIVQPVKEQYAALHAAYTTFRNITLYWDHYRLPLRRLPVPWPDATAQFVGVRSPSGVRSTVRPGRLGCRLATLGI
jgi:hypothetical protein